MTVERGDLYVVGDPSQADTYHTYPDCQPLQNTTAMAIEAGLLAEIASPTKCTLCRERDDNGGPAERQACPECGALNIIARPGGFGGNAPRNPGRYRCCKCDHTFDQPATRESAYERPKNSSTAQRLMDADPDTEIRLKEGDA